MAVRFARSVLAGLMLASCTHSDSYTFTAPVLGPFSTGPDVQLTYNADQDYWPTWTQDGKGILYAYVDQQFPQHRCIGMLPPAGGTRSWSLCDNRAVRRDSISSYSAFALDSTGRMLAAESVNTTASDFPLHPKLVLFDTATPYVRTTLLTLPVTLGNVVITWLSDLQWTGPTTFLALGQQFGSLPHCYRCMCVPCPTDSIFAGNGIVVVGTIGAGQATLRAVDGTEGALGYSVINEGFAIAFVRRYDGRLLEVSLAGHDTTAIAMVAPSFKHTLLGVTCRHDLCLVADVPVDTTREFLVFWNSASYLATVSLASHAVTSTEEYAGSIVATPTVSPVSGDVALEIGMIDATHPVAPILGHLQTFGAANSVLHLRQGLLP